MDTLTTAQRSRTMSRIHSKDTGPEMLVRRALWSKGYRYRLHPKNVPGTPDLWFPKQQVAIFVHGCFWHGHERCALYRPPKTETSKWLIKVERNQARDMRDQIRLMSCGVQIVILWECALRKDAAKTISFLSGFLQDDHAPTSRLEIRDQNGKVHALLQEGRWENLP